MSIKELKAHVSLPHACVGGRLVQVPGHDLQTGVYADFAPDALEPVPESPTRADVVEALRTLFKPWSLFRFATPHDRASMLSAIFTAVNRCSLDIAPGYLADAPSQGSGKTKAMSALGALIRGSRAPVTPWVSGSGSESELAKKLVSLLVAGVDYVSFDNVVGQMSSSVLSALLTDGALSERLLGGNTWYAGVARMFICASSNNASLDRDLSRRFIRVRIDPGVERPNGLSFPFDPVDVALSERMSIARCVLVVIRAFHCAGAPRSGAGDAGFSQWNQLVRQCVLWVGNDGLSEEAGIGTLGDPAHSIVEQAGVDDPDTTALHMLLLGASRAFDGGSFSAGALVRIYNAAEHLTDPDDDRVLVREGLQAMLAGKRDVSSTSLGRVLSFRRDRPVRGLVLKHAGTDRNGSVAWAVRKV